MMGWRRRIRFWHVAVSIPVVFVMAGTIGTVVVTNRARADVEREMAALKSFGVPTTSDAMRRKIDVKSNAAPLYRQAIQLLEAHPSPRGADYDRKSKKPEVVAAMRAWIEECSQALSVFREATRYPDCDFNRDWSAGASVSFPELGHLKTFAKMCVWKAGDAADAGRFDDAFQWLDAALKAARHTREPVLIGALVSVAIEQIVLRELDHESKAAAGDPSFTAGARRLLENLGDVPSMEASMGGEVMFIGEFFERLDRGDNSELKMIFPSDTPKPFQLAMRYPAIRARVEALILRRYRHLFLDLRASRGDLLATQSAFERLDRDAMVDQSLLGQLASTLAPTFAGAGQAVVRLESNRRLSRAGVELWAKRRADGQFPAQLDPRKPWNLDPFSQSSFLYRRTQTGFVLYGVGPNMSDDGGSLHIGSKRTDDIDYWGAP